MNKPAKSSDHLSPFNRFKKLTNGLLAVPRKELQEKLNKYKRDKGKRKPS